MQEASHMEMPFSCYSPYRVWLTMAFVYVGGKETYGFMDVIIWYDRNNRIDKYV